MNLSPNFSMSEMTKSQTAARRGINNIPTGQALVNLRHAAAGMEVVRGILRVPILVSSAYRGEKVNALVGGSSTSDHVKGLAVDFTAPRFGSPYKVAKYLANYFDDLRYDQIIHEYGDWVHIGFGARARGQELSIFAGTGYLQGILPGPPR